jgi:hypothetical protein
MKNLPSRQFSIALSLGIGMLCSLSLAVFTPSVEAACRPTGRVVGGRPLLRCSGRTRCRPTGRFKMVRGVRYQILRCPR